jgi:hypothetical protein
MRVMMAALLGVLAGALLAWQLMRPPQAPSDVAAPTSSSAVASSSVAGADDDAPSDWPNDAPTPEQVIYDQKQLMDRAVAALKPQTPGKVDLYLLAFAGDGAENVFRNEAEYAARLFAQRFGAEGHTLVLENNPATLAHAPLATWSNLEAALRALGRTMDPDEDILFVYLTSHGGEDHDLLVDMDPLPLDQIGADDLAGILGEEAFRWKVVVVNACYSGGFIPPLRGDGTLVLTAARSDRTSFGCGAESEITYFGDAFLAHALNRSDDFIAAFGEARTQIATWEKRDKLEPSEPQIAIGAGIAAQLARWREGVVPSAPVPFPPAAGGR